MGALWSICWKFNGSFKTLNVYSWVLRKCLNNFVAASTLPFSLLSLSRFPIIWIMDHLRWFYNFLTYLFLFYFLRNSVLPSDSPREISAIVFMISKSFLDYSFSSQHPIPISWLQFLPDLSEDMNDHFFFFLTFPNISYILPSSICFGLFCIIHLFQMSVTVHTEEWEQPL